MEVTRSPTPSPSFVAALWGAHSSGSPRKVWRNDDVFVVAISPEALGEPPCSHGKRENSRSSHRRYTASSNLHRIEWTVRAGVRDHLSVFHSTRCGWLLRLCVCQRRHAGDLLPRPTYAVGFFVYSFFF